MTINPNPATAMVFAMQLQGDGSAVELTDPTTLGTPDKPVWLHGDHQASGCYEWLQSLNVPDTVIETLLRTESRPRVWANEQGVLLILRVLNMNPGQDHEDMVSLRMWIEKNRIVSVRQQRVFSVQEIRQELIDHAGPKSLQELVVELVDRIANRISAYVDELEVQIDNMEAKIDVENPNNARREISQTRRQAATIRRFLAPQRDALEKFSHNARHIMDEYHLYLMQDLGDRIVRYVEDLDLVREQTQVLLEELINRVSQEQNSRMYVLSIIAAIFLPISFVTGLFGMNVGGLPGMESPTGFLAVSVLMGLISAGIIGWFHHKKWL